MKTDHISILWFKMYLINISGMHYAAIITRVTLDGK